MEIYEPFLKLLTIPEKRKYRVKFFSDFEKAFDSINHDYLFKILKHFNFSENFIKWIKLFYSNAKSCVTNNGFLSPFLSIQRGVRQFGTSKTDFCTFISAKPTKVHNRST